MALYWLLRREEVTAPIIRARSLKQLEDNPGTVGWSLEHEQVESLSGALDPDDYLYPFWHSELSSMQMYSNPRMDRLIQQEQTAEAPDTEQRMQTFAEIQQLGAQDVPTLPLFVETPYAYAQSGVGGVQETMDPSQIFRYYLISKSGG